MLADLAVDVTSKGTGNKFLTLVAAIESQESGKVISTGKEMLPVKLS